MAKQGIPWESPKNKEKNFRVGSKKLVRSDDSKQTYFFFGLSEISDTVNFLKEWTGHWLSLVTRKPVLGVCDQGRLKPDCSASETSWSHEISDIEMKKVSLSNAY